MDELLSRPLIYEKPLQEETLFDEQTCFKLKLISIYCLFLFVFSIIFNLGLLLCFMLHRDLRSSPQNTFTISLCGLNLAGTVLELPQIIASNYACSWIFPEWLCVATAFIMYWIGCSSIYILICMSVERFYIVHEPMSLRRLKRPVYLTAVIVCISLGLFWSVVPFFGWSHYSFEGAGTSCSVEWSERSPGVISYNITILVFVFLIPLIILVFTNFKLIKFVISLKNKHKSSLDSKTLQKKLLLERLLTVCAIALIGSFLFSWLPYALVCIYRVFFASGVIPPFVATLPAMFAKSSMLWSTVLYFLTNKKIRSRAVKLFLNTKPVLKSSSDSSIGQCDKPGEEKRKFIRIQTPKPKLAVFL